MLYGSYMGRIYGLGLFLSDCRRHSCYGQPELSRTYESHLLVVLVGKVCRVPSQGNRYG